MKNVILILTLLLSLNVNSQFCPFLGPDQFLPCGVTSTTLTADLSQCGVGANPNQTTNYNVTNIPFVAQTNTGATVSLSDDSQSGPFNIGFNFCYFGQTYTQFWIGSNGWISFSGGQSTTFTSAPIPNAAMTVPKNCIMGPWQDWNPGIGGQVRYQLQGTAPCRKLVVSWTNIPMFSCTNLQGTFHIVIYESSNYIENHIQNKPNCPQWANGTAVQGIHNLAGTVAVPVPGRNSTQWTTQNNAYRWTPSGPVVTPTLTWFQVGNPNPIGTGPSITVNPPPQGANYTCQFVYPICNAGWSSCNAGVGSGPDTVFVQPGPPNLPNPTVSFTNPLCAGSCDGTINVIPNGGSGVQTISWNGPPSNFNLTGLCSGSYNFLITDANGCTINGSVTLTNPPIPTVGPITGPDTICFGSGSEIFTVPDLGPGWNYSWNTVGVINSNPSPSDVDIDWSSLPSGFIPGAVGVISINPNGCPSLPVVFDVTIFNVTPSITPISPLCDYDDCVQLNATPLGGVFSGNGMTGDIFCPTSLVGNDTITYTYTQSGCSFEDTIITTVYPRPIISPINPDNEFFQLCEGDSVSRVYSITSNFNGYNEWTLLGNTYQTPDLNMNWNSIGTFVISVVSWANGCVSLPESTSVTISRCPEMIYYIPNAFTPDGDEHNNTFQWTFTSGFDPYDFRITIFNRWGETIFESQNIDGYWDGTYNNSLCQPGIYTYRIEFGDNDNDARYTDMGHISIIR